MGVVFVRRKSVDGINSLINLYIVEGNICIVLEPGMYVSDELSLLFFCINVSG